MRVFCIVLLLHAFLCARLIALSPTAEEKEFFDTVQSNVSAFEETAVAGDGKTTSFEVTLGATTAVTKSGKVYDGFRFVAPEGSDMQDFVWYFNVVDAWSHWYLLPAEGEPKQSFRNWLTAFPLYEKFDREDEAGRFRILQSLAAGYFEPGREYIMWFNRETGKENSRLAGCFRFVEPKEDWDQDDIVEALGLKLQGPAEQVAHLGSRGGVILLDPKFFDANYAEGRIESVFFSLENTSRMRGGFFITTQTAIPTCNTDPSYAEIEAKYGSADFVRTDAEKERKMGNDPAAAGSTTTYYYDYFGFEVRGTP